MLSFIILCGALPMGALALPDIWSGGSSAGFASGSGTQSDPYIIRTGEQLAYFSNSVKAGETYWGKYVKLSGNVELNDTSNYSSWNTKTPLLNSWSAIGGYYHISINSQSGFNAEKTKYGTIYQYVSQNSSYGYYESTTYKPDVSDYYYQIPFMGTFDGDGYTVSGIYIANSADYQGLFGMVNGGTLKNINVAKSYINARRYLGGVAGYVTGTVLNCSNKASARGKYNVGGIAGYLDGSAENCFNAGKIIATLEYVGGIVSRVNGTVNGCINCGSIGGTKYMGGIAGWHESGTVAKCRNEGYISGNSYIGGIAGYNKGSIFDCCNMTDVVCTGSYAGGITGSNKGTASRCFNVGKVYGWTYIGGIAGTDSSKLENCYYLSGCANDDSDTAQRGVGSSSVGSVTADVSGRTAGLTKIEMKNKGSFNGFDFDAVWTFDLTTGCDYPQLREIVLYCDKIWDGTSADGFASGTGTEIDPFIIETAEQLAYFSDTVRNGRAYTGEFVKLAFDIFLNNTFNWKNWNKSAPDNVWTPIGGSFPVNGGSGYQTAVFNGTFDGDGNVVHGLYTDSGNGDYQGLFGYADEAEIKNLGVVDSCVCGVNYVGGVVGLGGNLTDCYNTGDVYGNIYAGGIAGKCVSLTGSYNAGSVTGSTYVGALAGSGSLNKCYYLSGCAKDGANVTQFGNGNAAQGKTTADVSGKSTGLTITKMKNKSNYAGFDFTNKWTIDSEKNNGLPQLIKDIRLKYLPDKIVYAVDDAFDITGLTFADYLDNEITGGFTTVPANGYVFKESDVGSKKIAVSYNGSEYYFDITVTRKDHYSVIYKVNGKVFIRYDNIKVGGGVPDAYDPSLKGYVFEGWSPEIPLRMPDHDVEIEALFSPITYKVAFYDGQTKLIYRFSISYDKIGTLSCDNIPQKGGYEFSGWSSKNGGVKEFEYGEEFINLTYVDGKQVNYYAVWTPHKYTVNLYDGTRLLKSFALEHGESGLLYADNITPRKGYTFMGWSSNNGATVIQNNGEIRNYIDIDGGTVNFYTYWQKDPVLTEGNVAVEFSPNVLDGNVKLRVQTVTSGAAMDLIKGSYPDHNITVYNIEALLNGSAVQPAGNVAFKIKLPVNYDQSKCKLLLVDMNKKTLSTVPFEFKDGCFDFEASRFGVYAIVDMSSVPKLEILKYTETLKVDFKATVTFYPVAERLPDGAEVHWFINGADKGAGDSYTVKKAKKNYTVQLKALDKKGNVILESGIETVSVKRGFFNRLVAFFRSIFGTLPKIEQK